MQRTVLPIIELLLTVFVFACFGIWLAGWGTESFGSATIIVAGSIAAGVIGNFSDRIMVRGASYVASMLELAVPTRMPPNHDVVRSLWIAQLSAVAVIARQVIAMERTEFPACDRTSWAYHEALDRVSARLKRWIQDRTDESGTCWWPGNAAPSALLMYEHVDAALDDLDGGQRETDWLWRETSQLMRNQIAAAGIALPPSFDQALAGDQSLGIVSWEMCVKAFFWEEVKTKSAVYRVLSLARSHG